MSVLYFSMVPYGKMALYGAAFSFRPLFCLRRSAMMNLMQYITPTLVFSIVVLAAVTFAVSMGLVSVGGVV